MQYLVASVVWCGCVYARAQKTSVTLCASGRGTNVFVKIFCQFQLQNKVKAVFSRSSFFLFCYNLLYVLPIF